MTLVIKKRVSLEFLGEEYKEAYLVFKSIPLKDYEAVIDEMPKDENNKEALKLIVKYLKKYFVSGKFPDDEGSLQDVTAEDVEELDADTAITCFQTLMGQRLDPKSQGQLTNPSSTEAPPQEN